jgi:hypothetical protein
MHKKQIKRSYPPIGETDYYSSSTTLLTHPFGKIDFFSCCFARSRAAATRRGQNSKKKSTLPNKCASKVVEERPRVFKKKIRTTKN